MRCAHEGAGLQTKAYRDNSPTRIPLAGLALLVLATHAAAAAPIMDPPDTEHFCARLTLQPDGETLLLSSPVSFDGKIFKHKIRAGMNSDRGADVFGAILNICGERIARPPMAHQ